MKRRTTGTMIAILLVLLPLATASAAQSGTPAHGDQDAAGTSFLFTQTFTGGTLQELSGSDDLHTLTLNGAPAQTVYFSDRPSRVFGTEPTQDFLDRFGFDVDDPPNAALVAEDPATGEEDVLILELLNPRYDAEAGELTYDARVLAEYDEPGLAHIAVRQRDAEFPASFGEGALFIDSGDADTIDVAAQPNLKVEVGGVENGKCGISWTLTGAPPNVSLKIYFAFSDGNSSPGAYTYTSIDGSGDGQSALDSVLDVGARVVSAAIFMPSGSANSFDLGGTCGG